MPWILQAPTRVRLSWGLSRGRPIQSPRGSCHPRTILLAQHDVINVISNLPTSHYEVIRGDTTHSQILCQIANLAQPYETLNFTDPTGEYAVIDRQRRNLQSLDFSLTNASSTPLTLNSYWYCSVAVETVQDMEVDILAALETLNQTFLQCIALERRKAIMESLKKSEKKCKAKK